MSKKMTLPNALALRHHPLSSILAAALLGSVALAAPAAAQPLERGGARAPAASTPLAPCTSTAKRASTIVLGKSELIRLNPPASRLVVGGIGPGYAGRPVEATDDNRSTQQSQQAPAAAPYKTGVADVDVMLLGPSELYLLGKRVGTMNVILQNNAGDCTVLDVVVTMDAGSLQAKLSQLLPDEKNVLVSAADDSLILSGEVSDPVKVDRVMTLAAAFAPEKRLVNLLRSSAVSQVMLEVKVAEVSKTLLDKLGSQAFVNKTNGKWTYSILSSFLSKGGGLLDVIKNTSGDFVQVDGEKSDGLVRVLAEPNIMAISGQQASFLSGGKIFIPVAQTNNNTGGVTITLEEKEFGIGVKFTPTVLEGDRINLRVASEVSELSQTGSPFTTVGNVTAVLPSFTTRRADTAVQLKDGQSFAIAGLIKNNLTESVKRFPILGEIPIIGALFRSAEFQKDMTELLFIITPRLVKPLPSNYALPTDNFMEPDRATFLLGGQLEGKAEVAKDKPRPPDSSAPKADASGPVSGIPVTLDENGVLKP
jgi:pilus assembly protein CpaC